MDGRISTVQLQVKVIETLSSVSERILPHIWVVKLSLILGGEIMRLLGYPISHGTAFIKFQSYGLVEQSYISTTYMLMATTSRVL